MPPEPFHIMTKPIGPLCNLDCEYCYYLEKENLYPHGESFRMSDQVLETYIRSYIQAQPGPEVSFAWQGGEPTLLGLDFFRNAVRLQNQYLPDGWRCTNALQTNGTLLTDEWCEFLRDEDFLVGISIDGPAPLHDRYRLDKGGQPTHDKVMRGLRLLQAHEVAYNVLCVVNDVNSAHPLEVYRFFRDSGVEHIQFIPIVEHEGGGEVSHRSASGPGYGAFLTQIFDEWIRCDVGKVYVQIFEECFAVWIGRGANLCIFSEVCGRGLAMEHNGDLFACDHFVEPEFKIGNIMELPVADMANSESQRAFGLAKRDSLPQYCLDCEVRFMCNGGCPKNRFMTTPDGEPGLNYLCAGYRSFFNHVDLYMTAMADLLGRRQAPALIMKALREKDLELWKSTGRNDPCPCGSAKKYKKCCWNRPERPYPHHTSLAV